MIVSRTSRAVVACNIYVSAGGHPLHRDLLMNLLSETQDHCCRANHQTSPKEEDKHRNQQVVLVHAFRDGPYDRSSFHLAGSPDLVADVGSSLASRAVEALLRFRSANSDGKEKNGSNEKGLSGKRHPTVGLVDHVSVLPLVDGANDEELKNDADGSINGSVARSIGETLRLLATDVLYYGHAHPDGKELAAVRRESTGFFDNKTENDSTAGQATVGAPPRFVENYNIRLQPTVSRSTARTLTELVRERGGVGLPYVEALTLKYGPDQYEVACNLLDPTVTSSKDIDQRMRLWEDQQQRKNETTEGVGLIETAYRVGTTAEMCLNALRDVATEEGEKDHNEVVKTRFEADFMTQ